MSVILDALKRVQDENRGGAGAAPDPEIRAQQNDALLRKLAAPSASSRNRVPAGDLSNAGRIGLLGLSLLAIVAVAAWVFEPSFTAGDDTAGRPLLSDLTGAPATRPPAVRPATSGQQGAEVTRQPVATQGVATPGTQPGYENDDSMYAQLTAAQVEGPVQDNSWRARNYSDLSANLPPLDQGPGPGESYANAVPNPANAATAAPASANGGGYIDLTSEYNPVAQPGRGQEDVVVVDPGLAHADAPRGLIDPGVRAAFDQGVRLQKAGDIGGAEEAYKRALKFDPYNAPANANLGVLYETQDRLSLAERHLRAAIEVAPDNANAHNNLGVVLYRMGNYDGALIEFNRTLNLDPDRLDAYVNKGLIFTRWGRLDDAERSFLQVLAREPGNGLARYNLGLVYEETDQIERALAQYYEFLSASGSDHPEIVNYLSNHIPWLEARVDGGNVGGIR